MEVVLLLVAFAATAGLLVYSQRLVSRIKHMEALNQKTGVLLKIKPIPSPVTTSHRPSAESLFYAFSGQTMDAVSADRHEIVVTKHLAQIVRQGHADAERNEQHPPAQASQVATLRGVVDSWLPADLVADIYALGQASHGSPTQLIQARAKLMTKLVSVWQSWGRHFTPHVLESIAMPIPTQAALTAPEDESVSALPLSEEMPLESPPSENPR